MTGRLVLAWSAGATVGLVVGWVYGSHVQRLTEAHRLAGVAVRVPEPRTGAETGTSATPAGAQRLIPAQRDDEPCPQYSPGGGIPCSVKGPHTAHIFLGSTAPDAKADADEEVE